MKEFFEAFQLDNESCFTWQIGPLQLWIKRSDDELCVFHEETEEIATEAIFKRETEPPEDVKWRRWASGEVLNDNYCMLTPVLHDKPVVVRPENELSFLPNTEGVFYARIPVWIAVMSGTQMPPDRLLCEIPTKTLSNTWFGPTTTRGELCFGMQTSAKRSLSETNPEIHRAVCPVRIKNISDEIFHLQRLCLRVEHLNIYMHQGSLWTSRVEIVFKGPNKSEQTTYNDKWFAGNSAPPLISERRTDPQDNIFKRSFDSLKVFNRL